MNSRSIQSASLTYTPRIIKTPGAKGRPDIAIVWNEPGERVVRIGFARNSIPSVLLADALLTSLFDWIEVVSLRHTSA